MADLAEQIRWQEAMTEAQADIAAAPHWKAEKAFAWHLNVLRQWGTERGYPMPSELFCG